MEEKTYCLNLSQYYSYLLDDDIHHKPGNDLKEVPHGMHRFAGILFDTNGLIQLSGKISEEKTGTLFPSEIKAIPVFSKAEHIHFLHGASWHDTYGSHIGTYKIYYANGHCENIPILYGKHVTDWWCAAGDTMPDAAQLAWSGSNDRTRGLEYSIKLFAYTWANPIPEIEIISCGFVSEGKESAPFLMAITLE